MKGFERLWKDEGSQDEFLKHGDGATKASCYEFGGVAGSFEIWGCERQNSRTPGRVSGRAAKFRLDVRVHRPNFGELCLQNFNFSHSFASR